MPVIVGLAVAATLVQGALARSPAPDPPIAAPPQTGNQVVLAPPEAAPEILQSLRPGLEKTPLSYLADYWLQLGAVARPKLVRLGAEGLPGIVVMRGLVVAPLKAAEPMLRSRRAATTASEGSATPLRAPGADGLLGLDTGLGIALLRLPGEEAATAFPAPEPHELAPGALLAAVSLAPRGGLRVVPGHLASTRPLSDDTRGDLDAVVALPDSISLAALVDLDGALLGIAVSDQSRVRYWSYNTVARAVARLASDSGCQGLSVAALDPDVAERLGVEGGLLVEALHPGAFGEEPPIRPGDVLLDWGGEALTSATALQERWAAATPGEQVRFRVLRDRRRVTGRLEIPGAGCLPLREPPTRLEGLGLEMEWEEAPPLPGVPASRAWRVLAVDAGGAAEESGLAAGDWILGIDGRSLEGPNIAPVQGLERRDRPVALTLLRDERVRLVLVRPVPSGPDAE
jgi:S1-C subfamily serine protease